MPPSVTSRDLVQGVSLESDTAALAISSDTELTEFPFMQLPVEIRLEIYGYLLVAYPSRLRPRKSIRVVLECEWHKDQWKMTAILNTGAIRNPGSRSGDCDSIGLTPQILRTCKAIYREATPMLYSENIFQFQPRRDYDLMDDGFPKDNLEALCREFHPNPAVPLIGRQFETPIFSILAVFLRQIGQRNAASLKMLMFFTEKQYYTSYAQKAGRAIKVVTQLLKYHVPGLGQVAICRGLSNWDKLQHDHWELLDEGCTGVRDQEHDASQINVPRAQTSTVNFLANEVSREFQTEGNTEYEQKLPGSHVDGEGQTAELPATSNSHAEEKMENDTGSGINCDHVPSDDSGDETFSFARYIDWNKIDIFDDEGPDGQSRPPLACRREEQETMHKAIADMVQEITWLKQLSFAGFDEDDPVYQKMKDLQMLVKTRR